MTMLSTCTVFYVGWVMRRRNVSCMHIGTWLVQVKSYYQIVREAPLCVCRELFNRADQTFCPISNISLHMFRLAKL